MNEQDVEDSPFLVNSVIRVQRGSVLEIGEGVQGSFVHLFLANNSTSLVLFESYNSKLIIEGELRVLGSEKQRVIFQSSPSNPDQRWSGIEFSTSAGTL